MASDKKEEYMIICGYTVFDSQITSLKEGFEELRKLDWITPEPILVKVVAHAKEIV